MHGMTTFLAEPSIEQAFSSTFSTKHLYSPCLSFLPPILAKKISRNKIFERPLLAQSERSKVTLNLSILYTVINLTIYL